MTDFNQVNFILKLWSCSRQPAEYHVSFVLNSCKNNLPKSVNILLGQLVCWIAGNNYWLFVTMIQEKCALNLNSLLFYMSHELDHLPQDTTRNLIGSRRSRLWWTLPVTDDFVICFDMWHDHPGKFVLTLLNIATLCCRNCLVWLVIQDTVLGQCTFVFSIEVCYVTPLWLDHNDDAAHRICIVIPLIVVEDSKAWSGWHGDNRITRNTSTANWWLTTCTDIYEIICSNFIRFFVCLFLFCFFFGFV